MYQVAGLYDHIESSHEELLQLNPNASVILVGDFNKLNVAEISERTGLLPLVNSPTREANILDMIMTSVPQQYHVKVITSSVRTDHKAILATMEGGIRDRAKKSCVKLFRRRTPGENASLLLQLRNFEPPSMADESDIQTAWEKFYMTIGGWLGLHYPQWAITITSRDKQT